MPNPSYSSIDRPNDDRNRQKFCSLTSVRLWVLLIVVLAAISGGIAAIAIYVGKEKGKSSSGNTPTTTPLPQPGEDFVFVDCIPESTNSTKDKCQDRGCLWSEELPQDAPRCYFGPGYGYSLNGDVKSTSSGAEFSLTRKNKDRKLYGEEVDNLRGEVTYLSDRSLRIKITDANNKRYEVPIEILPSPQKPTENKDYKIEFYDDPQFGFKITRLSTNTIIFNTDVPGMVFSDQFLQITSRLPSENVYGLGERRTDHFRNRFNSAVTMFARDVGTTENTNLYGTHPFYLNVESDGNAHGVFFLNSNAMQVTLQKPTSATFRSIGGILDIFVFVGPTPEEVVQQYLQVIGYPRIPPYWALGFQLSRWGYFNIATVQEVEKRNIDAHVPWDIQTFDIDYMQDYRIFTIDQEGFKEMQEFVKDLHNFNRKLILIMDPAVASNVTGDYPPLQDGIERDIFVKYKNETLQGEVWPGSTYFPDFSHPGIVDYWANHSQDLINRKVDFDGMWLDMNEPSSFVDGSSHGCEHNKWNYPPFTANVLGSASDGRIYEKTICMDAQQNQGMHYNIHSLYGYFHAKSTFEALVKVRPDKRPMILARSTYPGSGRYTSHWLGDNDSSWSQLRISIQGMLSFSLFGIPHVGADICGFNGNTTDELCLRWTQLGAFYPFSRNHNTLYTRDQDPASFQNETIREGCIEALKTRYRLLPYLYTLFYEANSKGSTVARPLVHEFPADNKTWDIDFQFLWGPALLISPVVYEGDVTVEAYFPEALWYDYYTGVPLNGTGRSWVLDAPHDKVVLHVRGGYILPMQEPSVTTYDSRKNNMQLFVAPDENNNATGRLFMDDGETLDTIGKNKYLLLNFQFSKNENVSTLVVEVEKNEYEEAKNLKFSMVKITNQIKPNSVILDGQQLDQDKWKHDDSNRVLEINEKFVVNEPHKIEIQ